MYFVPYWNVTIISFFNYKKFFIDHDVNHIDEIADYFGFRNTKQSYELIKEYNRKNWEVYEGNSLH